MEETLLWAGSYTFYAPDALRRTGFSVISSFFGDYLLQLSGHGISGQPDGSDGRCRNSGGRSMPALTWHACLINVILHKNQEWIVLVKAYSGCFSWQQSHLFGSVTQFAAKGLCRLLVYETGVAPGPRPSHKKCRMERKRSGSKRVESI